MMKKSVMRTTLKCKDLGFKPKHWFISNSTQGLYRVWCLSKLATNHKATKVALWFLR